MKDILQSRAICAVKTADFHLTTQFLPAFCLRKFAPLKGIPMLRNNLASSLERNLYLLTS